MCRGGQGLPFPRTPFSVKAALFLRCVRDRFPLTKANTSCAIELPASPRSDGVRVHPGMPFGLPSEIAFHFDGFPGAAGGAGRSFDDDCPDVSLERQG